MGRHREGAKPGRPGDAKPPDASDGDSGAAERGCGMPDYSPHITMLTVAIASRFAGRAGDQAREAVRDAGDGPSCPSPSRHASIRHKGKRHLAVASASDRRRLRPSRNYIPWHGVQATRSIVTRARSVAQTAAPRVGFCSIASRVAQEFTLRFIVSSQPCLKIESSCLSNFDPLGSEW
jgi:hypothetical protein